MDNWYGHARSNYFKVKDAEAFKNWVKAVDSLDWWETDNGFAIYSTCPESGGWPSERYDEDTDEHEDFNLVDDLAEHLQEGEVAILMEVGAAKLRYLTGHAIAVRSDGGRLALSLDDIYKRVAQEWGVNNVNQATY